MELDDLTPVDPQPPLPTFEMPENPSSVQLVEALLKAPRALFQHLLTESPKRLLIFFLVSLVGYVVYGLIIACFTGQEQWIAAPLKMTLGTLAVSALCYPSLYIFACISGLDLNPGQALAFLTGTMTMTAILLLGFAPVAFIFTFSVNLVFVMGMVHLAIWALSIGFGIHFLRSGMRSLSQRPPRLITLWSVILVLTMLQMSTTLRPLLSHAETHFQTEKVFFVEHWFDCIASSIEEDR